MPPLAPDNGGAVVPSGPSVPGDEGSGGESPTPAKPEPKPQEPTSEADAEDEKGPWWKFNQADWETSGNEKNDRDDMMGKIFSAINDSDLGKLGKIGSITTAIVQYLYKRKRSSSGRDAITKSGFGKQIAQAVKERHEKRNAE